MMETQEITLKGIVEIIRDHIKLILLSSIIGLALAGVLSFLIIQPHYSAETQLIVAAPLTEEKDAGNVDANLRLLKTYKDFIKGNLVLKHVSEQMGKKYQVKISPDELDDVIEVSQADDSQMFSITAENTDPQTAANIANVTASVFQTDVKRVLKEDQVVIVYKAEADPKAVSPNKPLNLLFGLLMGLLAGLGITFISTLFNRTLTSEQFIAEQMESPILGNIPKLSSKELKESILQVNNSRNNEGFTDNGRITSRRSRR